MKRSLTLVLVAVIAAGSTAAAVALHRITSDWGSLLDRTEAEQKAVRGELRRITSSLDRLEVAARGARFSPQVSLKGAAVRGSQSAPLTIVEFSDFQCPFCGNHARNTRRSIEDQYVATGKVRYAFRHFPIDSLHPEARTAAAGAICASDQGRFWQAHEFLFANQRGISREGILRFARGALLDLPRFEGCLESRATVAQINQDIRDAAAAGVQSTPTFLIGTSHGSSMMALATISGAKEFEIFKAELDRLLPPH